jgi:hypothetical protein
MSRRAKTGESGKSLVEALFYIRCARLHHPEEYTLSFHAVYADGSNAKRL